MTLSAESKRAQGAAINRQRLIDAARPIMLAEAYDAYDIRRLAREAGLSTGAIFSNWPGKAAFYEDVVGFPPPWRPISAAMKDGRLYLLLVDYSKETNAAGVAAMNAEGYLWSPNAIEDALLARTLGHNNDDNVGEGEGQGWEFAGWCWSHDHYTGGHGTPVAFIDLDQFAPLPEEPSA